MYDREVLFHCHLCICCSVIYGDGLRWHNVMTGDVTVAGPGFGVSPFSFFPAQQ